MQKFLTIAILSILVFSGCTSTPDTTVPVPDSTEPSTTDSSSTSTSTPTPTTGSIPTAELSTLMQENAQLMLQAGQAGVDARKREEWVVQAQAISVKMQAQDYQGAIALLTQLNAEMRVAIEAL